MELVEIDEPAADGGIVVDVHAAGVAFPDAPLTRGLYQYKPDLPFTLGAEVAGVVRSARRCRGQPGTGWSADLITGAMAETAVLTPERAFPLPDNVSFEAGAGLLLTTSGHFALTVRGRLGWGRRCWCTPPAGSAPRPFGWPPRWARAG